MNFEILHPRDQIVTIMERIYHGEMTTISGGNLSILDDNGDLWITPAGIDKGKLTAADIICVHEDGSMEGPHKPSSEYPFHRAIYEKRPDLRAIVHAHPPAIVAYSIAGIAPDTHIIPQANAICGPIGIAPYAIPGSEELGMNIADTLSEGYNMVILENHGLVAGGHSLLAAFQRMETLDFCARTFIHARRLGEPRLLTAAQLNLFSSRQHYLPEFILNKHTSRELELRQKMVEIVHRACQRRLMISTEGVISTRIDQESFLITPTGADRRGLSVEDIVLVRSGCREAGKIPSRSVLLHQQIYQDHPDIHCVITAQSPHAAAYAVTEVAFDTKTIPESYILLRDVPRVPFNTLYSKPHEVSVAISNTTPVLLIENDCVLTVGKTILQAFDRLEVLEYTAMSLLNAQKLGTFKPIGEKEIEDIVEKFLSQD
ncbi:MAG: class II aldolase/adducin family protein [Anaerolineae bacterium]|jgi:L-fuculose-phosphate aldolase|nr:class II aldolase/adducin family protein [Anaerolineae bacterium]